MADMADPKTVLHHYLQQARDALVWKLDGLSERDARLPRTPTGNNLLGMLKHCLNVEAGYFGPAFGREFPTPDELVPLEAYAQDPQADWYAGEDEAMDGLIDLYAGSGSSRTRRSGSCHSMRQGRCHGGVLAGRTLLCSGSSST
jgi:hypothetical protein